MRKFTTLMMAMMFCTIAAFAGTITCQPTDADGNEIRCFDTSSAAGEEIFVYVYSKPGFIAKSITVTTTSGSKIPSLEIYREIGMSDKNWQTFSFTMPNDDVYISATFITMNDYMALFKKITSGPITDGEYLIGFALSDDGRDFYNDGWTFCDPIRTMMAQYRKPLTNNQMLTRSLLAFTITSDGQGGYYLQNGIGEYFGPTSTTEGGDIVLSDNKVSHKITFVDGHVNITCGEAQLVTETKTCGYLPNYRATNVLTKATLFRIVDDGRLIVDDNSVAYLINEDDATVKVIGSDTGHKDIVVPETITKDGKTYKVTSIEDYAFYEIYSTETITLPSLTSIGSNAFQYCSSLKKVVIGGSTYYNKAKTRAGEATLQIGDEAFYGCYQLDTIVCDYPTPPSLGENVFEDVNVENCKLFVPAGCANTYKSASVWSGFQIEEMDLPDQISDIYYNNEITEDIIYDLSGRQVNNKNLKGIYIINGKKVLVK